MRPASRIPTLLLLAGLLTPAPAEAHITLVSSTPAANANLVVVPSDVRLVFSERPERAFTSILLIGPAGSEIALDTLVIGPGNLASARITGPMTAGLYTVIWRTVSRDGHPVRGQFAFAVDDTAVGIARVAAPADTASSPGPPPTVSADGARELAPFATLLRWVTLAGVIVLVGAVAFRLVVVSRLERLLAPDVADAYIGPLGSGAASLGMAAGIALIISALLRLGVQALAIGAEGPAIFALFSVLRATAWGWALLIHVAGAAMAVAGFAAARKRRTGWFVAGAGGGIATLGLALSGHALTIETMTAVTVLAHLIHATAAAGWLGVLLMIAAVALPHSFQLQRDDRWQVVADLVHIFSPTALAFAAVTVAAGVVITWAQVPSLDALLASEYGQVLAIKVGLVALTLAVGAYNWKRVRPSLGEAPGARRLRRSATTELALGALVLALTAVLVATPLPR